MWNYFIYFEQNYYFYIIIGNTTALVEILPSSVISIPTYISSVRDTIQKEGSSLFNLVHNVHIAYVGYSFYLVY